MRTTLFLLLLLLQAPQVGAQLQEPRAGVEEVALLLRQLDGEKRVLMIAAHPDDEDTALLTILARGMGARTAYLSLTRGEGGQNLIGGELDEGLGLIRTGELVSARSLDGAEQYFSRAFDFGFSKTASETFSQWPEEALVLDAVRLIRTLRPQILISVFSGTPRDGHGHHQAAGIVARLAFEAAGDASRFPELADEGLEPWAPAKLYRLARGLPEAGMLEVETGGLDPLFGRSHFQIAMASRSRHRSQDMGAAELPGPRASRLELVAHALAGPVDPAAPLFAGIDTALVALADAAGGGMLISRTLGAYREALARGRSALHPENPGAALPALFEARTELEESLSEAIRLEGFAGSPEAARGWRELARILESRRRLLEPALLAASGVVLDFRAERERVAPGETVEMELLVWNGGAAPLSLWGVELGLPVGWSAEPVSDRPQGELAPGTLHRQAYQVRIPSDTPSGTPYFLLAPKDGALYPWPKGVQVGLPGNPPLAEARVQLQVGGAILTQTRPISYVMVDKALGQLRLPVHLTPPLSVATEPRSMAWPAGRVAGRPVTVRVENLSADLRRGTVRLEAPAGWRVEPAERIVELPAGGSGSFAFQIRPLEALGSGSAEEKVTFRALVESEGTWTEEVAMIRYPHIDPVPWVRPAALEVSRFEVAVREGIRVGYVEGPGDGGVQALRDLGVQVDLLDTEALRSADLSLYDAVVLGARAYETRTDLAAANPRILAYAEGGGTVVVQYNKYEYPDGNFAPYPLAMRRPHDRVTDAEAAVTLLLPQHPLLRGPNQIGARDFEGWFQERGLYFLSSWDPRYTPLLEMADPGEEATRGGMVVARVGEGAYLYTGLALFRQLPRGIPGAFRLLANMVSLTGTDLAESQP